MNKTQQAIMAESQKLQTYWQTGQYKEALDHALELTRLEPGSGEFKVIAGIMCLGTHDFSKAVELYKKGISLEQNNDYLRTFFLDAALNAGIGVYHPDIKSWIESLLEAPERVEIGRIGVPWRQILKADPDFALFLLGLKRQSYADFKKWFDAIPAAALEKAFSRYFRNGIRNLIVGDMGLENFLTHLRHDLLDRISAGGRMMQWVLPLCEAMSFQCWLNEYAFYETEEEAVLVEQLISAGGTRVENILIISCYRPLLTCPNITASLLKPWQKIFSPALAQVIKKQIEEPLQERRLAQSVPKLAPIANKISLQVQDQYEAHPYPRWSSAGRIYRDRPNPVLTPEYLARPLDILIAGCGTGLHAALVGQRHPNAMVTGIDLSSASLGYARRKTKELGMKRLNLIQGDILDLPKLDKKFDLIESAGVLHHMKDPEQGWAVLNDMLKPGGLMRIALYSQAARATITAGQKFLAQCNLPMTDKGLREARKIMIDLPDDHEFATLRNYLDFYSTSMFCDLLLHVHEQCFTLPRIKADLQAMNLQFAGFEIAPEILAKYRAEFPQDQSATDLDLWNEFETRYPGTFIGMYQFWCKKPD